VTSFEFQSTANAEPTPDGGMSPADYNLEHGRLSDAPLSGQPIGAGTDSNRGEKIERKGGNTPAAFVKKVGG